MYNGEHEWSLGVLIGLPIILVTVVILLVLTGIFASKWFNTGNSTWDRSDGFIAAACCAVTLVIVVVISIIAYWPYSAEYHQWRTIDGTVQTVNKRLVKSGDSGMEEKIVVKYQNGGEYGCLDTRCSLLKAGDELTLTCKRVWQFTGTDGYDCNFVEIKPA